MKLKNKDYIIKEEFTERELDIFLHLVRGKGIEIEEGIKRYNYLPLTFWQLDDEMLTAYESDSIFDNEDNMTTNFRHYLKSLEVTSDEITTPPEKPFSRSDLEDGMVLEVGGAEYLVLGNKCIALDREQTYDLEENFTENLSYRDFGGDTNIDIKVKTLKGEILFDRAKEYELECLLKKQKDIEDKIKQLRKS